MQATSVCLKEMITEGKKICTFGEFKAIQVRTKQAYLARHQAQNLGLANSTDKNHLARVQVCGLAL